MQEQQLLDGFEPTEAEMVQRLLSRPLGEQVDHSIKLIKTYGLSAIRRDPLNGYQFGFSGGKDSVTVNSLLRRSGVSFKPTYNCTTIDPPELIWFIKEHYSHVKWNRQADKGHLILDRMVEKMSMPTRIGKWCCSEYKDCCSNSNSIGCVGVRIAESARREKLWKELTVHNKTGRWILAPVVYWSDEQIWEYIHNENIPYCELYDQGWDRLGCVGCPINPLSQAREFKRWPKFEAMWKEGCFRIWEKTQIEPLNSRGEPRYWTRFDTPDEMWHWWLTGEHAQIEPNCVFEEMMEGVQ